MDGWVIAGLVLLGAAIVSKPKSSGSTTQSLAHHATDEEIAAVADFGLLHETDGQTLRDLAAAMRVLPMGTYADPTAWNRRRAALEARANQLDIISGKWRQIAPQAAPTAIHVPRSL